jgi:hypothetical protein
MEKKTILRSRESSTQPNSESLNQIDQNATHSTRMSSFRYFAFFYSQKLRFDMEKISSLNHMQDDTKESLPDFSLIFFSS